MAQITKEKLNHLTSDEIKQFYLCENISDYKVNPINKYVLDGKDSYEMGSRINRVERILNLIIVERFINGNL
jgi:hypothetical protein